MSDHNKSKLSHQSRGVLLMLASVPLMVIINLRFEDQLFLAVGLGVLAAALLGWGVTELDKSDKEQPGKG